MNKLRIPGSFSTLLPSSLFISILFFYSLHLKFLPGENNLIELGRGRRPTYMKHDQKVQACPLHFTLYILLLSITGVVLKSLLQNRDGVIGFLVLSSCLYFWYICRQSHAMMIDLQVEGCSEAQNFDLAVLSCV